MGRAIEKGQQLMADLLDETDIDLATGVELDERAKIYNATILARLTAAKATGTALQFSRQSSTGVVTIAIGTQVKVPASSGGTDLIYETTTVGTIADGATTSNNVSFRAVVAGADYNVDPNTITGFVTKPSGVDFVTNLSSVTNGQDEETDDEFRKRIKLYRQSLPRGTVKALEGAVFGVEDSTSGKRVQWVSVVEDEYDPGYVDVYVDDGAGTALGSTTQVTGGTILASAVGGEVDLYIPAAQIPVLDTESFALYINAGLVSSSNYYINYPAGHIKLKASAYPSGLTALDAVTGDWWYHDTFIQEVQKVVDGDDGDRANYPGYRAAGVIVTVRVPTTIPQTVTANLSVAAGYSQTEAISDAEVAVSDYINNLGIGEDVIYHELVERLMGVSGVVDVQFTTPTNNVLINDQQVARITTGQITIT
jgi:uncharacterized phage protein gp47/JayE